MTQRSDRPSVGLGPSIESLQKAFDAAAGGPQAVLLHGRDGGGRRTAVDRFTAQLREEGEEFALVRLRGLPSDDGVRTLGRFYSSLVGSMGGKGWGEAAVAALDAGADSASDERVAGWLRNVAASARELRAHSSGQLQIKLPPDNPWLAQLYAFEVLAPRTLWIFDLFELGQVTSPSFWAFLAALVGRARARNWKVLFLVTPGRNLYSEKPSDGQPGPLTFLNSLFPSPSVITIPGLDEAAVGELIEDTYRPHHFPDGLVARLTELSEGHPDSLHELLDALEEDETITWDDNGYQLSDLEDVDLDVLVPMPLEEDDDDDEPTEPAEGGPDEAFMESVLHVAAHEGRTFSSALVRAYLGAAEDAVDDALDSMLHVVEELRYDQALGTWLYRFRHEFYRRYYRNQRPEAFKPKSNDVSRGLATIAVQTYAPASYEYLARAAELYTAGDDARGARNVLAMALSAESPALSDFALEVLERFPDSPWPDGLGRLLITSRADRAVKSLQVDDARAAVQRARDWGASQDDPGTSAFADLLETRLLMREGRMKEAMAQGQVALKGFQGLNDKTRAGETLNQIALIALNMGDGAAAMKAVKAAQKASTIPPVKAHSQYILGVLLRRQNQLPQALEAFTRSVELSERAGNLVLSLEAMLNRGECALMTGQTKDLVPQLERALEMSRALRSTARERLAARLLCQAEAAAGRGEVALEMARHALELTRELGQPDQEDIDLYHCGIFAVLAGKPTDGADYLTAARAAAEKSERSGLLPDILFNLGQIKLSQGDGDGAKSSLEQALGQVRQRGDKVRELRILEGLGQTLSALGDHRGAGQRFKEAADKALGPQAKEFRKAMRQRIAQEQSLDQGAAPSA